MSDPTAATNVQRGVRTNPYADRGAPSCYTAFDVERGVLRYANTREIVPHDSATRLSHDLMRSFVLSPGFPCVLGKLGMTMGSYRFGLYPSLLDPMTHLAVCHDLFEFAREQEAGHFQDDNPNVYSSFIVSFRSEAAMSEDAFEQGLWTLLQSLHLRDVAEGFAWDSATSSDPSATNFSFSFAERSFFVLGMHERSSRHSRRAPLATLVFNARAQFDDLRRRGTYDTFKRVIRELDLRLQGSINPSLSDFGVESEVRQYTGKLHDAAWQCPFTATSRDREGES